MNLYAKFQEDGSYLPLDFHLQETGFTAGYLYDHWLPEAVKEFLQNSMETDDMVLRKTIVFMGLLHDIGKATLIFQKNAWRALADDSIQDFHIPDINPEVRKKVHHSTSGAAILRKFGLNEGLYTVIGSHHGRWRANILPSYLEAFRSPLQGTDRDHPAELFLPEWQRLFDQALDFADLSLDEIPAPRRTAQILLTGILNMADWLASDTRYFPLIGEFENPKTVEERCTEAQSKFQITEPWNSHHYLSSEEDFIHTFHFIPRSVQKDVIEILDRIDQSGLMIIEAPMGSGKTEAALYAAQILAYLNQSGGIFYGLPTVATSNGIMDRIYKWAEKECIDEKHSFQLVHGKTLFNDQYQEYRDRESDADGLIVSEWMEKSKLKLCPNFVVGTVDYLLRIALKHNHIMLDHIGIAGKVVILDEIHSFDSYMDEYLFRALEWLGFYHAPVILLSATLHASLRKQLIQSYMNGMKGKSFSAEVIKMHPDLESIAYPFVTFADENGIQISKGESGQEKQIYIRQLENWDSIKNDLQKRLENGGCAGIIVNTVRQAQDLYRELKNLEPMGFRIRLLHSGFTDADRAEKEREIIRLLGKAENMNSELVQKDRNKLIVIGTQVLECSLDVDVDWLITEICPVDLLLQRIGRLHRHERLRPEALKTPECWIVGTKLENISSGTTAIYPKWLLKKTLQSLQGKESIYLPVEIPELIHSVYETAEAEDVQDEVFLEEYTQEIEDKKQAASLYRLAPAAPEQKNMQKILNISNSRMAEKYGEQAVRDCGISVEAILVTTDFCETARTPDGKTVSLLEVPDYQTAKKLLRSKIKLPRRFTENYSIESTINELEESTRKYFSQWLVSRQLNQELILPLDQEGKGKLSGLQIVYSSKTGLEYRKGDGDE